MNFKIKKQTETIPITYDTVDAILDTLHQENAEQKTNITGTVFFQPYHIQHIKQENKSCEHIKNIMNRYFKPTETSDFSGLYSTQQKRKVDEHQISLKKGNNQATIFFSTTKTNTIKALANKYKIKPKEELIF